MCAEKCPADLGVTKRLGKDLQIRLSGRVRQLFIYFLLGYHCFTLLCQLLLFSKVSI